MTYLLRAHRDAQDVFVFAITLAKPHHCAQNGSYRVADFVRDLSKLEPLERLLHQNSLGHYYKLMQEDEIDLQEIMWGFDIIANGRQKDRVARQVGGRKSCVSLSPPSRF